MKITFVTVSVTALHYLAEGGKGIDERYRGLLNLKLYNASKDLEEERLQILIGDLETSDLVFIDLMGSPSTVIKAVYEGLDKSQGHIVPFGNSAREYLRLGKFTAESMKAEGKSNGENKPSMEQMKKMKAMAEIAGKVLPGKMRDMRNYSLIMKYFRVADSTNMINLLYFLMKEYGNIKQLPKIMEPREVAEAGICDPKNKVYYKNLEEYHEEFPYQKEFPTIAILFYGHTYPTDTAPMVVKVKEKLEAFANIIPIALAGNFNDNEGMLRKYLISKDESSPDLIINFMAFRLGAGPMGGDSQAGEKLLKEAGVPYFHPFFMTRRRREEWEASIQGCSPSEVLISVMLPELDGAIETYPIAAMGESTYDDTYALEAEELVIIEDRLEKLAERCKGYLKLRSKPNREKRIAVIGYNYPPGEGNLFGGAFLDTFASIENILKVLKIEGYSTEALDQESLMDTFTDGKIVNSGKYRDSHSGAISYDTRDYIKKLNQCKFKHNVERVWGPAPGSIMVDEDNQFIIPGKILGNIFVGLQPTRGIHEELDKNYHDKSIPPHHQYQAFYQWIVEEFKADAILHVGTHGTLEFLKGKECGMSQDCYPDRLIGDIPHIYLYYCGNPSEAVIAKRRSHANVVSYQPPVFMVGGLYGSYSRLNNLLHQYQESLGVNPVGARDILKNVKQLASELNLPEDIEELERELYRMQMSLVPKGLHVFGKGYSHEEALSYLQGYLRSTRNAVVGLTDLLGSYFASSEDLEREGRELLSFYLDQGFLPNKTYINRDNNGELLNTLNFAKELYEKSLKNYEIQGLLRALSGKYNEAKLAGDLYRSSDVLPTGFNLYQFDPRQIPTETAFQRGHKIAQNTIDTYKKDHEGQYPQSTGVILWGIETSRTQGETFGQILSYLGVRILPKKNEWEPVFQLIPIEELGRPRIDVTINICGFFRDMFPNLIDLLDDILQEIYEADETEDENYIKGNSRRILEKLLEAGYPEDEAKTLAIARIFGPQEGTYGTNLTGIIETKNWSEEAQLGTSFMDSLQYVYSKNFRGRKVEGLYQDNLKSVDIISQVRSNHEYEITDLDHYYEFFGGLAKSVEMVKGKKAKMYISDTTNDYIFTESVEKSVARGIRSRTNNPIWIEGMMEHKYHGVQKISKIFENLMGLAATTNSVDPWIYDDLHKTYVEDEELRRRMIESNPYAYMDILQQMMEYYDRGYWDASEDQLEKIKEINLLIEDEIEEKV